LVKYVRIRVKSALQRSGLPDIDYALNPYAGCFHSCRYCYAPYYTPYREVSENWGEVVYIKENIVELLQKEIRSKKRGVVGVSTITDPYQPVEREEMLTRRSIKVLLPVGFHVSIQTKSDLVLRDVDVLTEHSSRVDVGLTIITIRDELAKKVEPYAPPPSRRLKALYELSEQGIETWVFLGPIIPGFNDNPRLIEEVIEVASEAGSEVMYDYLHLKSGLEEKLALSGISATSIMLSRSKAWRKKINNTISFLCKKYSVKCKTAFPTKNRTERNILNYFS